MDINKDLETFKKSLKKSDEFMDYVKQSLSYNLQPMESYSDVLDKAYYNIEIIKLLLNNIDDINNELFVYLHNTRIKYELYSYSYIRYEKEYINAPGTFLDIFIKETDIIFDKYSNLIRTIKISYFLN